MSTMIETVLFVDGMTCPSCTRHVDHALRDLDGVGAIRVELRTGRVTVQHDPARAPIADMQAALAEAGYPVRGAAALRATRRGDRRP